MRSAPPAPAAMEDFLFQVFEGIVIGSIYALMALGLNLIWSITDVPDFSQGGIYVITAYVSYFALTQAKLPFIVAWLAAIVVGAALSFVFERFLYRRWRGRAFTVLLSSIALFFLLANVAIVLWTPKAKILPPLVRGGVDVFGVYLGYQRIVVFIAAVISVALVHLFIQRAKVGKAIRAASQDREAAMVAGINIDTVISVVFMLGGALSATAAALVSPLYAVHPAMGDLPLLKSLVVVILGGFGTVGGVMAAALLLGVAEALGAAYISSAYQHGFAFFILILILLLRPKGLFGRV